MSDYFMSSLRENIVISDKKVAEFGNKKCNHLKLQKTLWGWILG